MSSTDPIAYFLEDMEQHGRNERTLEAYHRVLATFEDFLDDRFEKAPTEAGYRDCMTFMHDLRGEYAESTVATYASYLNRFYGYLVRVNRHDRNPMELVLEEMAESIETNPSRRDISLEEMRSFIATIGHPLHRSLVLTLAKTGMRSGELCNLDLVDIHLDHRAMDWEPRPQLQDKANSIFVAAEHQYGLTSGGTRRTASNKRKRETLIPIDAELQQALVGWLLIRPDVDSSVQPLYTGTADAWGSRITIDMVHHVVERHARNHGWYQSGAGAAENVTPHYFRHFFTTHLRDRTGDRGVVKYLRGDVASDVIETYTHNWNDRVRALYLEHIYTLT